MAEPTVELLRTCELHVHVGGCFFVEDLTDLARDLYEDVDWSPFEENFERAFGRRPDAVDLFRRALSRDEEGLTDLRRHYILGRADGGDFHKFIAKFSLLACLYRHFIKMGRDAELVRRVAERHRAEGLDYIEYRALYPRGTEDAEDFLAFHHQNASVLRQSSVAGFTARYIISLPRRQPLQCFELVERLLRDSPELVETVVGIDLCDVEEGFPPKAVRPLFEHLERFNSTNPELALEVVYHVGESFFDKSLESAVRWCHEAAELGARRLGHVIALGLDPEIAVARRPRAHETELVSERLDQIAYDLSHADGLSGAGVNIETDALEEERCGLQKRPDGAEVERAYSPERLEEVRQRQEFVLTKLDELGAVVECCPTSNALIGAVGDPGDHPVHRLLDSQVGLVIGADDPGIFDSPLAAEIDWVENHSTMNRETLCRRLGDPHRFRLGALRP